MLSVPNNIFVESFFPNKAPYPNPPKEPGQVKKLEWLQQDFFKGQYPVLWIGIDLMPIRFQIPMLMPMPIQIDQHQNDTDPHAGRKQNIFYIFCHCIASVRHVTGNDKDYLRKIPRVVW